MTDKTTIATIPSDATVNAVRQAIMDTIAEAVTYEEAYAIYRLIVEHATEVEQ